MIPARRGMLVLAVLLGFFGMHVLPGHDAGTPVALAGARHAAMPAHAHGDTHPPGDTEGDHHEVCVARPATAGVAVPVAPVVAAKVPFAEPAPFRKAVATLTDDGGPGPPCLHKLSVLRI